MFTGYLAPRFLRPVGLGMAAAGILLAFFRFYFGFKPDILDVKVFAVY